MRTPRPYSLLAFTLEGDQISAISRFGDSGVFPRFGLPRTLRDPACPGEDVQLLHHGDAADRRLR